MFLHRIGFRKYASFSAVFAVLGGCLFLCSCSGRKGPQAGSSGQSIRVSAASSTAGQSILLQPTGSPSGVLCVKMVQGGKVETLATCEFKNLEEEGNVSVNLGGGNLTVDFGVLSDAALDAVGEIPLPEGAFPGSGFLNSATYGASESEHVVWGKFVFTSGALPGLTPHDSVAAFQDESKNFPNASYYLLTIEIAP